MSLVMGCWGKMGGGDDEEERGIRWVVWYEIRKGEKYLNDISMVQALYSTNIFNNFNPDYNLSVFFVIMNRTIPAGFCILYSTRDPVFRRHS